MPPYYDKLTSSRLWWATRIVGAAAVSLIALGALLVGSLTGNGLIAAGLGAPLLALVAFSWLWQWPVTVEVNEGAVLVRLGPWPVPHRIPLSDVRCAWPWNPSHPIGLLLPLGPVHYDAKGGYWVLDFVPAWYLPPRAFGSVKGVLITMASGARVFVGASDASELLRHLGSETTRAGQ